MTQGRNGLLETPLEGVSAYLGVGEVPGGEAFEVPFVEGEAFREVGGFPQGVGFPGEVRGAEEVEVGFAGDGVGVGEGVVEADFGPNRQDDRARVEEDRAGAGLAGGGGLFGEEALEVGRAVGAGEDGGVGAGAFGKEGPAGSVGQEAAEGGFTGRFDAGDDDLA